MLFCYGPLGVVLVQKQIITALPPDVEKKGGF